MTKLLHKAFTALSNNLNTQDQDRIALFILDNENSLSEFFEKVMEEQRYEENVKEAFASDEIQEVLVQLAEKYDPDQEYSDAVEI